MKWYQRRVDEAGILTKYGAIFIAQRLHKKFYTCLDCGELIPDDEIHGPSVDLDNNFICDECRHSEYDFVCTICDEWADDESKDDLGRLLIITDAEEAEIEVGTYKIVFHPYWSSDMFSMTFFEGSLEKISDDIFHADTHSYAAGHICERCTAEVLEKIETAQAAI